MLPTPLHAQIPPTQGSGILADAGLVDAVFVLSVRSFTARIAHAQAQMDKHGIGFTFMFDHDADAIPPELIDHRFAPSDMKRAHQSLVLKHIATWQACITNNLRSVLVFEDDAVLATDFVPRFSVAMAQTRQWAPGWCVYLGCGDNKYAKPTRGSEEPLMPGGPLPATDALVFDHTAAARRLAYLESHRITRPADWLIRETDAAVGTPHWWLRQPIVEQGSMNGLFRSVLDGKRQGRPLWLQRTRFTLDRLSHRLLGTRTVKPPHRSSQ